MTTRIEYAAVVGRFHFPWDMLRYDFCSPASEGRDSAKLERHNDVTNKAHGDVYVIVVKRWAVAGRFTPERWESFGWHMILNGLTPFYSEMEAREAGEAWAKERALMRGEKLS